MTVPNKEMGKWFYLFNLCWLHFNPSRPDLGWREKINLFLFLKKALKAFIKPFEAPLRSVKIKI